MEYQAAKAKFLQEWGVLGSQWGINRTMAQIHALLLISPEPICVKEVMDELKISLGNANMNLRALMDWGLIYKVAIPGERKDFYEAEKDIWEVVKRIIKKRKERELEPVLKMLDEVSAAEGEGPEVQAFRKAIQDIRLFSGKADALMETLLKADSGWVNTFMKMVR
ncbi:MAG: transcriptional regulator [Saprospirales bacterium]|nr:transcriptional regulator [Saprospirales bacterium]